MALLTDRLQLSIGSEDSIEIAACLCGICRIQLLCAGERNTRRGRGTAHCALDQHNEVRIGIDRQLSFPIFISLFILRRLLKDYDNADAELVIYATSLINKTLAGLTDQDSFYDESDLLEQQGMETVIQRYMSKPGTDLDLLDQLQLYEAVLK